MAWIPVTLSELEGHFCCYDWQNASRGPSASAAFLVNFDRILFANKLGWKICCNYPLHTLTSKWPLNTGYRFLTFLLNIRQTKINLNWRCFVESEYLLPQILIWRVALQILDQISKITPISDLLNLSYKGCLSVERPRTLGGDKKKSVVK